jgi:hypothetical protein
VDPYSDSTFDVKLRETQELTAEKKHVFLPPSKPPAVFRKSPGRAFCPGDATHMA